MPIVAPWRFLSAWALLALASPAIAAGPEASYEEYPSTDSAAIQAPQSTRQAELRRTLEKRKARRARDHAAYQRATAQANAMLAAALTPPRSQAAFRSLPTGASPQAANLVGFGGAPAYYQIGGQAGSSGVYSAGGTGQCGRR